MRYRLKKKYFDGVPANQVRTTSPLKHMSDEEWRQLVDMWSSPEHKVMLVSICLSLLLRYEVAFESVCRKWNMPATSDNNSCKLPKFFNHIASYDTST
jgi:hypothetical protein